MQFRLDIEANALYVTIKPGTVTRTIALTEMVYVDIDAAEDPLGIEFVSADEFLPFLRCPSTLEQNHEWQELVPGKVRELFAASAA